VKDLKISRRSIIRGAGGAVVGLPFLEAMLPRRAHAAAPKRFVVFFSPNGTVAKNWRLTGAGNDQPYSRILKPLEPLRSKINIISGTNYGRNGSVPGPGDGHMQGMCWMLTGRPLLPGQSVTGGGQPPAGLATGISIDQEIANAIGKTTPRKSVVLGVRTDFLSGNPLGHMSYAGKNEAVPVMQDPSRAYFEIFNNFKPTSQAPDPAALRKAEDQKSVVDAVKSSFDVLAKKVGVEDGRRLALHLDRLRELESRLQIEVKASAACTKAPDAPPEFFAESDENFEMTGKFQTDLLVNALACGITRVGALQWSRSAGGPVFEKFGATRGHHDISHDGVEIEASQEILTKINVWYAERFMDLLKKMDAIDDGDGKTLLDNSIVVWCNELAQGDHTLNPLYTVVAGGAGGSLQTGRILNIREPNNNLLLSYLKYMDTGVTSFGEPSYSTGPLTGF